MVEFFGWELDPSQDNTEVPGNVFQTSGGYNRKLRRRIGLKSAIPLRSKTGFTSRCTASAIELLIVIIIISITMLLVTSPSCFRKSNML